MLLTASDVDGVPALATVPSAVAAAGERASRRYVEFFAARIRNPGTRKAYAHAAARFFDWCESFGVGFDRVEPVVVAAYVEHLGRTYSPSTVKVRLAALRMLFDFLVTGQIVPFNPAASVRGPRHVVTRGKTPVLSPEQARRLLDGIERHTLIGLRDRALVGVMVYSFARVSAAAGLDVQDVRQEGRRLWLRLSEKGGREHHVPCHHRLEELLDDYLDAAGLREQRKAALFQTVRREPGRHVLTGNRMRRTDVLRMVKKRAETAGLPADTCCHSFRATGITAYLSNGGTLEHAARIAGHSSVKTTKLYDRTSDAVSLDEVERVVI